MTAAPHSPMEMRVSDDRPNMFDPYVAALRIAAADAAFLGSRRQRRAPTTWPATGANYKLQLGTVSSRADGAAMRPAQRSKIGTGRKMRGTRTHRVL